ncbi:geranylgeranylglyceryl/heptaprenylglyceryl phosphate synthase [Mesohalobacter halotolerans]|uniref:Geranylgeranylglyceryl phosphate synthase n=1 Tax=Mesohalobacter halotolerans TaxID=1883405 RepID=A0A4U5TRK1_9FLAO|nr:geranylgeranylglyceryl/heptaprenylglyceryl phosphate synthase [Mesohalobacter halotolerans]MBS3737423.1 geranylgeranylglyceryl/heptaprenylglyceryl phosphate synthase [Psychroflexus sp.]TKS56889.1 geranylgeranylglyceryl/heptaprenylglyceryl phosphate synthase [Mesohalobacter halotolerans]
MIAQSNILKQIQENLLLQKKSFAVLIDPDKVETGKMTAILNRLPEETDFIFVGGSTVENHKTDLVVKAIKASSNLPIILFHGNVNQISSFADAILFLSLMSGDNPEYLIHQQVKSVKHLKRTALEIIPTGYILIDGGKTCTTERVTETKAIPQTEVEKTVDVALAAQYAGKQLIYLEAGSSARYLVHPRIIKAVKAQVDLPLIVGGGIRTKDQRKSAYRAGADMVVMGTAFEKYIE